MIAKIQRQIARSRLLSGGEKIMVGVSGGPDSACLLDVLTRLINSWPTPRPPQLHVCHLNHRLRGVASDADERFVRALAKKYHLPCIIRRRNVRALAKTNQLSMEEAARQARLDFFTETGRKIKARKVALAHNADDQAETFLLRLLRGAGARGLSAMRSPSKVGELTIARPLLEISRAEILEYLRERQLKYRTDASNRDLSILRNRIRHRLLPLLERDYRAGIRGILRRTADILGEEDTLLDELAEKESEKLGGLKKGLNQLHQSLLYKDAVSEPVLSSPKDATACNHPHARGGIRCRPSAAADGEKGFAQQAHQLHQFNRLPLALRRRIMRQWLARQGKPFASFEEVERMLIATPQAKEAKTTKPRPSRGAGRGRQISARIVAKPKHFTPKLKIQNSRHKTGHFDADKVGRWSVRYWQPGDRMCPLGMSSSKKLQDIFVDAKVPVAIRGRIPLVIAENGQIAWVLGVRMSENFKVTAQTRRLLRLRATRF